VIKYLGSKRRLVPLLVAVIRSLPGTRSVADLFSGTARVGHALKAAGLRVRANDHNAYAATLARAYVQADREDLAGEAGRLLAELDALPGRPGWFTETFCVRSRFLQPENGARVDAIRDALERLAPPPELRAVLLASLMEAADRVDSTTGVQMAYLKSWAPRSGKRLTLRLPALLPRAAHGKGEAHELDAGEAAARLSADVAYLDPPYNQHKYLGNYHVWESLVRWDRPEVYGTACKRVDCRTRASAFNSRAGIREALARVVREADARHLVVSFSDEGFLPRAELEALLSTRGRVTVLARGQRRYVGAQIGIYNPRGERVGQAGHLRNTEYVFVATRDAWQPPAQLDASLPAIAAGS
jgi:adenine-specific DNA-methyltransferase